MGLYKQKYRFTMKGYIQKLLIVFSHPIPNKPQLATHNPVKIHYSPNIKYSEEPDNSPKLSKGGILRIQ